MADYIYDKARQKFMEGVFNLTSDTIKVSLVDSADYTEDSAAHDFIDDVPSGARVATSSALSGKSVTNGVFNASGVTFSSVTGDPSEYLIIWKDTTVESTSPLICKMSTYTGMPITPNGGNITITWPTDSNKIFKL